ncbi:Gfo/Idh/MocA family oxidoreductase [Microbacterium foliorum]
MTRTYIFDPLPEPVVGPDDFVFAAVGLDHGHIFGMVEQLIDAGATLSLVYDPDPAKLADFVERFPQARAAAGEQEVLDDPHVRLVASASIANQRARLGVRVLDAGKDFFADKPAITTMDDLAAAREAVARTGQKFAVYYGERVHSEAAILAGQLIDQGAIGTVLQVASFGPHRIGTGRPAWFYDPEQYGGIICDIGSHNFEQMLYYTGATAGEVVSSTVANYAHRETPGLQDFGDAHVVLDNGTTGYVRVDWFTPAGLDVFGDGRTVLLGTDGYIELRKYTDITTDNGGGQVLLVNQDGQFRFDATGKTGFPFFGQLIRDCLDRTEHAMTQQHAFTAAELSIIAQRDARVLAG